MGVQKAPFVIREEGRKGLLGIQSTPNFENNTATAAQCQSVEP